MGVNGREDCLVRVLTSDRQARVSVLLITNKELPSLNLLFIDDILTINELRVTYNSSDGLMIACMNTASLCVTLKTFITLLIKLAETTLFISNELLEHLIIDRLFHFFVSTEEKVQIASYSKIFITMSYGITDYIYGVEIYPYSITDGKANIKKAYTFITLVFFIVDSETLLESN